ncbi:hypothetical protein BJ170DRAFT_232800 [Xylariales sp. AK1849]|nr:hypothetical protein BJ170DRAFT_232800 [Xylariales sp. AK1849]
MAVLAKALLLIKLTGYMATYIASSANRALSTKISQFYYRLTTSAKEGSEHKTQNIVIIGASFAGLWAARNIAASLPPHAPYRVVVVEPHSHFHFTWVLPRFSVVPGHEHKAFIPYSEEYINKYNIRWVRDRVSRIRQDAVVLEGSGEELTYEYLVVATGSAGAGLKSLPSRVGADGKVEGMYRLTELQQRIEKAKRLVVVGAGAAGVELAADAKALYPEKSVTLVHSRDEVMHRFGPELREAAMKGLRELGVEVIVGERLVEEKLGMSYVKLRSGRKVECDCLVQCTGQTPASGIMAEFSPTSISGSGHIRVKPTLQILDDSLPRIYACGDVADTGIRNTNARSAIKQAEVAADNIVAAAKGKSPDYHYKPHWADGHVQMTLGLDRSIMHFADDGSELLFRTKAKGLDPMSKQAWRALGTKPFEDASDFADLADTVHDKIS